VDDGNGPRRFSRRSGWQFIFGEPLKACPHFPIRDSEHQECEGSEDSDNRQKAPLHDVSSVWPHRAASLALPEIDEDQEKTPPEGGRLSDGDSETLATWTAFGGMPRLYLAPGFPARQIKLWQSVLPLVGPEKRNRMTKSISGHLPSVSTCCRHGIGNIRKQNTFAICPGCTRRITIG
jgi:hypothetical protein